MSAIKRIVSVYDSKAQIFNSPFTVRTPAEAIRGITAEVNNPGSALAAAPDDYILYDLGSFNEDTGEIIAEPMINLGVASNFVQPS